MRSKIIGFILILLSFALYIIFYSKITGAVINTNFSFHIMFILIIALILGGILFLSRLEKKIWNYFKILTLVGAISCSEPEKPEPEIIKIKHPFYTIEGKFERTYRWDEILDKTEEKWKIPKGLLKGLAMRESYGDPLKLNEGGDGGVGLFMFQPGTAKHYGLKVYGSSKRTGRDRKHGKVLKDLIRKNKNNYNKLAILDERFSVEKSSNAAAHFLKDLYRVYGSWDKALSAYNRGIPARKPYLTQHVKKIREYQRYYNERDKD